MRLPRNRPEKCCYCRLPSLQGWWAGPKFQRRSVQPKSGVADTTTQACPRFRPWLPSWNLGAWKGGPTAKLCKYKSSGPLLCQTLRAPASPRPSLPSSSKPPSPGSQHFKASPSHHRSLLEHILIKQWSRSTVLRWLLAWSSHGAHDAVIESSSSGIRGGS